MLPTTFQSVIVKSNPLSFCNTTFTFQPLHYAKYTSILVITMPRKSVAPIETTELLLWKKQLIDILCRLENNNLADFLEEFLTEEEYIMLAKRLQIYSLLYRDTPQKEVQQELGVSRETIRIYNYNKNEKSNKFKSIISKTKTVSNNKTKEEGKLANFVDLAIKSRSNLKARAKLLQGDLE